MVYEVVIIFGKAVSGFFGSKQEALAYKRKTLKGLKEDMDESAWRKERNSIICKIEKHETPKTKSEWLQFIKLHVQ